MKILAVNVALAVLSRTMELPCFSSDVSGCSKSTSTPASLSTSLNVCSATLGSKVQAMSFA